MTTTKKNTQLQPYYYHFLNAFVCEIPGLCKCQLALSSALQSSTKLVQHNIQKIKRKYFCYEMFAFNSEHLEARVLSEVIPNAQRRELNKQTARFILSSSQQANKNYCMLRISCSWKLNECGSQKSIKHGQEL